jgi:hypothetical protein
MRTGAAVGYTGHLHEALYYASDEDLLAVVAPSCGTGWPRANRRW